MIAHLIKPDKNEPDKMTVIYCAAKSIIRNPSRAYLDRTNELLTKIVNATLKDLQMNCSVEEKEKVRQQVTWKGLQQ